MIKMKKMQIFSSKYVKNHDALRKQYVESFWVIFFHSISVAFTKIFIRLYIFILLSLVVFNGKTFFDVGQPIRSLEGNSQTPLIQALN